MLLDDGMNVLGLYADDDGNDDGDADSLTDVEAQVLSGAEGAESPAPAGDADVEDAEALMTAETPDDVEDGELTAETGTETAVDVEDTPEPEPAEATRKGK